ncbi:MAG: helix-turn-helix domain-containing protein [Chloroflexota bacterium]
MDDRTVGLVLRALRRRRRWTQDELSKRAGCSQSQVSIVEAGHLGAVQVDRVRRLFAAVDARLELLSRWRGADLERLLDQAHSELVAEVVRRLELAGWDVAIEVTYSEYGERGSIDVLGTHPLRRAALVIEVKSDLPSAEGVGRKLDEKTRLAPKIVLDRFGWRPAAVGRLLVLPETGRLRRLARIPAIAAMLPADAVAVRRWLRSPTGSLAATWFLPDIGVRNPRRVSGPPRRVPGPPRRASNEPPSVERQPPQPPIDPDSVRSPR